MEYFDDSVLQPPEQEAPLPVRLDAAERRYKMQCERMIEAMEELDFDTMRMLIDDLEEEAEESNLQDLRDEAEMRDELAGQAYEDRRLCTYGAF